jgi:putative salt-induced outer membrane protein YdiY
MTKGPKRNRNSVRPACLLAAGLVVVFASQLSATEPVTLHLQNGDRLSGFLISETNNTVTLSNAWSAAVSVPVSAIARREVQPPAAVTATAAASSNAVPSVLASSNAAPVVAAAPPPPSVASTNAGAKPVAAVKPKAPDRWRTDLKLGADMIRGAKDRDVLYSTVAVTYARPYDHNPKQFFRNRTDYRVDYATTDGVESANRMMGSNKTDFDVGDKTFIYNFMGVGYDEVRRIDLQAEIGPGVGYRMVRSPKVAFNVEGGLNYQMQDREGAENIDVVQFRLGDDITWKIHPRVTFTQKATLLAALEDPDELQLRLEGNVAFGLVQNLTFNITALELYDTRPVPGVTRNEFQLRSSLGLTF